MGIMAEKFTVQFEEYPACDNWAVLVNGHSVLTGYDCIVTKEQAQSLVVALISHDALVAALREIYDETDPDCGNHSVARAALTLAGEKP
jgi:hypothetical protein